MSGQSGYGVPPAQAQPPKKSRVWLWFLIGIPLLAMVGIGGCTALLFATLRGPLDTTNAFVANIDNGDLSAAWELLCTAEREAVSFTQWEADIQRQFDGEITGYNFTSAERVSSNGSSSATVSGVIEIEGVDLPIVYYLLEENGEWRVC